MFQLPWDVSNLIGSFAYGGKPTLENDLYYVLETRGMIPDAFLSMTLLKTSTAVIHIHRPRDYDTHFDYDMVQNPLRTDTPFFPWSLISPTARVFSNTFTYWAHSLTRSACRELKTYPKTFRRYARMCIISGKHFADQWNRLFKRYLQSDSLQQLKNYNHSIYTGLFTDVCYSLQTAGFVYLPSQP